MPLFVLILPIFYFVSPSATSSICTNAHSFARNSSAGWLVHFPSFVRFYTSLYYIYVFNLFIGIAFQSRWTDKPRSLVRQVDSPTRRSIVRQVYTPTGREYDIFVSRWIAMEMRKHIYINISDCLTLSVQHYSLTFFLHLRLALMTLMLASNEIKIPQRLKTSLLGQIIHNRYFI